MHQHDQDQADSESAWNHLILHELRHGIRRVVRHRTFSLPAVLTLTLGLGITIATFAMLESIALSPLPYPDAERLVRLETAVPGINPDTRWGVAKGEFLHFQDTAKSFVHMGIYQFSRVTLEPVRDEGALSVEAALVSSGIFPSLGARLLFGRLPEPGDHLSEQPRVAWLGHDLWQARFSGSRDVVGRTMTVDGRAVRIVGVLEPGLHMPEEWLVPGLEVGLWMPLWLDPAQPPASSHVFRALARLGEGVSPEKAAAEIDSLTAGLPMALPSAYSEKYMSSTQMRTELVPLHDYVVDEEVVRALWLVFAVALLALLIACANVVNLFLAHAAARRGELVVRTVLGASKGRLFLGFLAEALFVTTLSGGLGWFLAHLALRALKVKAPSNLPRLESIGLDLRSMSMMIILCLLISAALGLLTAFRRSRTEEINTTSTQREVSRQGHLSRRILVVAQIALSFLLVMLGALFYQSVRALVEVDSGFQADGVLTFSVVLPSGRYDSYERMGAVHHALVTEIEQVAGVKHAAIAMALPMSGFDGCSNIFVDGTAPAEGTHPLCVVLSMVSPGYFDTLGIQVAGAAPTWAEAGQRLPQAVVGRSLAERLWPGVDPIGHGVALDPRLDPFQVVAVADDVRMRGLDQEAPDIVYLPMAPPVGSELWPPLGIVTVIVRTDREQPTELLPKVRQAVGEVDHLVPLRLVRTMGEVVALSMAQLSFLAWLLTVVSMAALLLSVIGIYSVVSYQVKRRRAEIGVRMALGAHQNSIRWLVVAESTTPALVGVGLGVAATLVVGRMLESLLYGISANDVRTMVGVAVLLIAIAIVASLLPAIQASKAAPMDVLRE